MYLCGVCEGEVWWGGLQGVLCGVLADVAGVFLRGCWWGRWAGWGGWGLGNFFGDPP